MAIILSFIGLQMVISSFKESNEFQPLKFSEFFLFGFAVSIDSFSLGITLPNMNMANIFSPLIFALTSSIFTFIGLSIGNKIKKILCKLATVIGGVILTIIGILYFL